MRSLRAAVKPQKALETSCCDGCTSLSQLPKNRGWHRVNCSPVLPNSRESPQKEGRSTPHTPGCSSAQLRVHRSGTIKAKTKRDGDKQSPREVLHSGHLPRQSAVLWVGGAQHRLCISSGSPDWDRTETIPASAWGWQTKQKAQGREGMWLHGLYQFKSWKSKVRCALLLFYRLGRDRPRYTW